MLKNKLKYYIFILIAVLFYQWIGSFVVHGQDYFEIKEMYARKRPWPSVKMKDGNIASDDPWNTLPQSRYYVWSDDESGTGAQVFHAAGEAENQYGKIQIVEAAKAKVQEKDIENTLADGSTIYGMSVNIGNYTENSDSLFNAIIDLDFYDRTDGTYGYDEWVVDTFKNRSVTRNDGEVVNFSEDGLKAGQYTQYTAKGADPDQDGFWSPWGGVDAEENSGTGGGDGKSEYDLEAQGGSCYPQNWGQVSCKDCEPPISGVSGVEEFYERFQSAMYGYGTLSKCYNSRNGCGGPSDPTGSLTYIQHERWTFGGLGGVGDPGSFKTYNSPSSTWASTVTPYDNGENVVFSDEFCFTVPILRYDIKILGPTCSNGETGIVTNKIVVKGANGTIYDSSRDHPDLFPMECVPGTSTDGWEYQMPIGEGEYFDLTSGSTLVDVDNPYALIGDFGKLDSKGRWGSFFGGYRSEGGPTEAPVNYASRCGDGDENSGKIEKVMCEHDFPHTKDSASGQRYVTGNYLDLNGDNQIEDILEGYAAFTNYEEFVWDTDPLVKNSSDLNNFLYTDEMSIAGVGRNNLALSESYASSLNDSSQDLGLSVEGITQIPMDTIDSSYWIGTVDTDGSAYVTAEELDIHLSAVNNDRGGWSYPTTGQRVKFQALIVGKEDSKVDETADYTWNFYFREKNSTGEYQILESLENKQGLHEYNDFTIDREGSYLIEVIVTDRNGKQGEDDFEFDVNGDFDMEYPLAIKGNKVSVKASLTGPGIDQNTPLIWRVDNERVDDEQLSEDGRTLEFDAKKNPPDVYTIELSAINIQNDNQEDSIKTQVRIPVVEPTVTISTPNMVAGSLNQAIFTPGEKVVFTAIPGPAGSSIDEEYIVYYWDGSETGISRSVPSANMEHTFNGLHGKVNVTAFLYGDDGTQETADSTIFLISAEENVLGVSKYFQGKWRIAGYSILGLLGGLMLAGIWFMIKKSKINFSFARSVSNILDSNTSDKYEYDLQSSRTRSKRKTRSRSSKKDQRNAALMEEYISSNDNTYPNDLSGTKNMEGISQEDEVDDFLKYQYNNTKKNNK